MYVHTYTCTGNVKTYIYIHIKYSTHVCIRVSMSEYCKLWSLNSVFAAMLHGSYHADTHPFAHIECQTSMRDQPLLILHSLHETSPVPHPLSQNVCHAANTSL